MKIFLLFAVIFCISCKTTKCERQAERLYEQSCKLLVYHRKHPEDSLKTMDKTINLLIKLKKLQIKCSR